MALSNCPACGATVDVARIDGTEETVPLELSSDASLEAPRYRIVGQNPTCVVRVVAAGEVVGNFPADHRFDCAGFNAGRRPGER